MLNRIKTYLENQMNNYKDKDINLWKWYYEANRFLYYNQHRGIE